MPQPPEKKSLTDLVIAADEAKLDLTAAQIASLLVHHAKDEALRRIEQLGAWLARTNRQNHDGVMLTPPVTDHFAQDADFESLLKEVEHLRSETRAGHFRIDHALQRELEYNRFATEYRP